MSRDEFIAGLRELADWLQANPAAPTPAYGREVDVYVLCGDDTLGRSSVEATADALGLHVKTGAGEVLCRKQFAGGLVWAYRYLARQRVAAHEALMSYHGAVQTEDGGA